MKPFLTGRKNHSAAPLRPAHTHSAPSPGGLVRSPPAGPVVEVVKEGDKVVRLVVTCSCGERIEVECLYPAGA